MTLQENKERGLELFLEGMSLSKISAELHISRPALTNYIKSKGHSISNPARKYRYNDNFFKVIDTEEKAYWLGFIYADGCVTSSGKSKVLEITLKASDKGHLIKFINAVGGVKEQISPKAVKLNGKIYRAFRATVCSTTMCNDLIEHGAIPRKSLVLKFPTTVPIFYMRHFLRGYFDGDGHIDSRRISLLGTKEFLVEVQNYFEIFGASKTKIKKEKSEAYSFEKWGNEVVNIVSALYNNSTVYLDRKFNMVVAVLSQGYTRDKSMRGENRRKLKRKSC